MNQEEIKKILPHREPFLLLDEVDEVEAGQRCRARKYVRAEDPWFAGHFPGHPVMPGVLIVEALAQTGAVACLSLPEWKGKIAYFGGINKAKFKRKVVPGDILELEVSMERMKGPVGTGQGKAYVDGKEVCRAELIFYIGE